MNLAEVDALVEQCVSLGSRTVYSAAEIRFATLPFLTWAVNIAGVDADLFELFSTSNIEQFIVVARESHSSGSLGNLHSRLFDGAHNVARIALELEGIEDHDPPTLAVADGFDAATTILVTS